MKKLKFKKSAKKFILISIVILVFLSIGIYSGLNIYKQKQYEKTIEYKLISLGYTKENANTIEKKYKDKEITYILENKQNDLYLNILNEKYFIYDNFYKYIDYYKKNSTLELSRIIEIINTNCDKDYYSETYDTDITKKELMLVNKYYHLNKDYIPENLVTISTTYAWGIYGSQKVTKDTYDAFLKMWNASHDNGFYLMVSSSYRDYNQQESVYNTYKTKQGEKYADKIAARPGYSEHQTGYSLDIFEKGYTQKTFQDSDSYKWLQDNAYKYGFIERYPLDKVSITGYEFESWHYRYVGIEAATYIYNNHITFDEYYAYFVK